MHVALISNGIKYIIMNIKTMITGILLFTTVIFGQFEDPVSITASVRENVRAGESAGTRCGREHELLCV